MTADKYAIAFTAVQGGSERAFQHLLRWLTSPDVPTRNAAACTCAELLYHNALDEEHIRFIEATTLGWKREIWQSSFDTRYLGDELEKALARFEPCAECGHAPCDCDRDRSLDRADEWNDERH
jgi:hypothetical protein